MNLFGGSMNYEPKKEPENKSIDSDITYIVLTDENGNTVAPDDLDYNQIGEIISYLYESGEIEEGNTCVFTADPSITSIPFEDSKNVDFDCSNWGTHHTDKLDQNMVQIIELIKDTMSYVCGDKDIALTHKFLERTSTLCKDIKDMYLHGREILSI